MKHLKVEDRAACTDGDVTDWDADALLVEDPRDVDCQRCIVAHDPRATPIA